MTARPEFQAKWLDVLLRHDLVHAVVWMSKAGKVRARRGQAMSLKIGADEPTAIVAVDATEKKPREAVYIRGVGQEEYLVVVFDDRADFDQVKRDVDETLRLQGA
jgi:hypothetical protein